MLDPGAPGTQCWWSLVVQLGSRFRASSWGSVCSACPLLWLPSASGGSAGGRGPPVHPTTPPTPAPAGALTRNSPFLASSSPQGGPAVLPGQPRPGAGLVRLGSQPSPPQSTAPPHCSSAVGGGTRGASVVSTFPSGPCSGRPRLAGCGGRTSPRGAVGCEDNCADHFRKPRGSDCSCCAVPTLGPGGWQTASGRSSVHRLQPGPRVLRGPRPGPWGCKFVRATLGAAPGRREPGGDAGRRLALASQVLSRPCPSEATGDPRPGAAGQAALRVQSGCRGH